MKKNDKTYLQYTLTGTHQVFCLLHIKYTSLFCKPGLWNSPCLLRMLYLDHLEILKLYLMIDEKMIKPTCSTL